MKEKKKFLFVHRAYLLGNLFWFLCLSVVGNLTHELLIFLDKGHDEEMTVFPLGAFLVILIWYLRIVMSSGGGVQKFNYAVSMGTTRKTFFKWELISGLIYNVGAMIFLRLEYAYEMWKFKRFYLPEYSIEMDLSGLFTWYNMIALCCFAFALSIFCRACTIRFGSNAYIAFMIMYCILVFLPQLFTKVLIPAFPQLAAIWTVQLGLGLMAVSILVAAGLLALARIFYLTSNVQ